uniref:ATP synthase subunit a n=1 Tax=Argas africolumbae TaxID=1210872 RepID=K7QMB5_ARGAF|nr:ATP synthase F0 subunit 6 [Argas africolumbae]AFV32069.1 ATP synthase F0 subunit 6 [Argas africolumbae]UYL27188.1 ATP synthase F0 subunit 6 [Argas africolumbae]
MMMNLFSIFDPSSSPNFSMNWISILTGIMFMPLLYWVIPSRLQLFWLKFTIALNKELNNNFQNKKKKFLFIFTSIFWLILMMNFLGLFPYIFTPTSHINITSFMSLPLWLTFMIFGWMNFSNSMFSHLVPLGTPMLLSSFMVCIETISNIIRPLTLAVRLSANMISGHLLICLLSNTIYSNNSIYFLIFPGLTILMLLESAVAIIQSYVFITLTSLYLNELN